MIQILNRLLSIGERALLPKDMHEDGVNNLCAIQRSDHQLVVMICSSPCFL
jgi:hypothetical protein